MFSMAGSKADKDSKNVEVLENGHRGLVLSPSPFFLNLKKKSYVVIFFR